MQRRKHNFKKWLVAHEKKAVVLGILVVSAVIVIAIVYFSL